jgi:hypothetical protein
MVGQMPYRIIDYCPDWIDTEKDRVHRPLTFLYIQTFPYWMRVGCCGCSQMVPFIAVDCEVEVPVGTASESDAVTLAVEWELVFLSKRGSRAN